MVAVLTLINFIIGLDRETAVDSTVDGILSMDGDLEDARLQEEKETFREKKIQSRKIL